jgi:hypothetical protein
LKGLTEYLARDNPEPTATTSEGSQAPKPSEDGDLNTQLANITEFPDNSKPDQDSKVPTAAQAQQNEAQNNWDPNLLMSREEQLAEQESIKVAMKRTDDVDDALQYNGQDAQAVKMVKTGQFPEYAYDMIARDILASTFNLPYL